MIIIILLILLCETPPWGCFLFFISVVSLDRLNVLFLYAVLALMALCYYETPCNCNAKIKALYCFCQNKSIFVQYHTACFPLTGSNIGLTLPVHVLYMQLIRISLSTLRGLSYKRAVVTSFLIHSPSVTPT